MIRTVLSIIIPVYNAESYLARCLNSIIVQAEDALDKAVEVICVDDGSKDGSLNILNRYAEDYAYIRAIHQDNAGPAAARNAGLGVACGEWVWFVDPDDYVDESAIGTILNLIVEKTSDLPTETDVMLFDAYENRGNRTSKWEHFDKAFDTTDSSIIRNIQREVLYPTKTPIAAPWDKVYRRQFLADNGLIFYKKLRVLDDMFFNLQAFGVAKGFVYSKKKIYHYIRNTGSITASYTPDRIEKDREVWKAIEEYIDGREFLRPFMYKRIVKSFAIALKLSVFNQNNPKRTNDQLQEARRVLNLPEYKEAFDSVKIREVEWRLRPVIMCVRIGWMRGLWLLTKIQEAL